MNPYKDMEDNPLISSSHLNYEDIATKLLKDNYFLTALELHTELVENGKELPQLREFFSNPGNFEQHVSRASEYTSMHRTPSQATLDSLDTARYSEDGGGDRGASGGDVAVLEFELRKARETINALRANLTQFADGESTLEKHAQTVSNEQQLKPHEKRALNFLINEYLLLQDYKLTSITFSDENPEQEFEDWDDVGLNMPRPAGLVSLFRGKGVSQSSNMCDASTQMNCQFISVDIQTEVDEPNVCVSCQTSLDADTDWNHELLIQAEEIELLKQKVIALETEKLNFQKLYDAAIVSLNSLTSPSSEKVLDLQIPEEKLLSVQNMEQPLTFTATENHYGSGIYMYWNLFLLIQAEEIELLKQKVIALETEKLNFQKLYDAAIVSLNSLTSPSSEKVLDLQIPEEKLLSVQNMEQPLTFTATENHYGSGNSTHSATPEQFEMIDSDKNSTITRKEGSTMSSLGGARRGSATTLDETLSMNDAGEWTRLHMDCMDAPKQMWIDSGLPNNLKLSILNWCCDTCNSNEPLTNDLLAELVANEKPISLSVFLTLVAETLPRILPHTLVGRRCEAAAALAACAALLPASHPKRAPALHTLLTLLKKPEPPDARLICEATCIIVKWGGSGEVLSSIAELLASRSTERRLLASQITVAIAPYVPIELCTSLLLSLVVMMCESNEPEIRNLGLKAACLICPVAEHKYGQLETLMFTFLKDPVEKCVKDTLNVFVPVLARTALIAGKFTTDFCPRIMKNLRSTTEWKTILLYVDILKVLVLSKVAYIINVQIVKDITLEHCDIETVNLQEVSLEENECFIDLQSYFNDGDAKMLLMAMNSLIKEKPEVRWAELRWFIELLKETLDVATESKALHHTSIYEHLISLFTSYVDNFGLPFTQCVIKPIFLEIITDLEQKMEKLHTINVDSTVVVGIYLVVILPALDDHKQHAEFLQKWIVYSSIRSLPVKIFSIPLKWVSEHRPDTLDFYLQHLREFSASSCESSTGSLIRVYIACLLNELLNIGELSERCIERQLLPAAMALLHDADVAVREVAITAWGTVTRTCLIRSLACEEQCWPPLEHIVVGNEPLSAREAARAAEAIALLVLPTPDSHAVSERAVSVLCSLVHRSGNTAECIAALTPGLQLAAHHASTHPEILPALRKMEETIAQAPHLAQYKAAIDSLIHNLAGNVCAEPAPRATNMHAAHEVGRRVTQMFNQSKTNMHLQNIFKKKT